MSEKSIKNLFNYEKNVPRCGNCTNLKSYPAKNRIVFMKCEQLGFAVKRNSCCDLWESKKGVGLNYDEKLALPL